MKAAWIFEECDAVLRQVAKNLSSYATGYKLFEVCLSVKPCCLTGADLQPSSMVLRQTASTSTSQLGGQVEPTQT